MEIKIIVLGCFGVGKTSILHKLKNDKFVENLETTIAIDYISQNFEVEGKEVKVQFWDTAGQEKYNNITQNYYRKADGVLIVTSCDKSIQENISEFEKYLNISRERDLMLPNFLLLNKKDLVNAEYLQEINKSQHAIEGFKSKYKIFDFRVVSAKITSGQEFITLLERFVKTILKGKQGTLISQVDTIASKLTSKVVPSRLEPSAIEPRKDECCS